MHSSPVCSGLKEKVSTKKRRKEGRKEKKGKRNLYGVKQKSGIVVSVFNLRTREAEF
jgi:hypothetical protein